MTVNYQCVELGDPLIRRSAKVVKDPSDGEIKVLIRNMIARVQKVNGVGIAAPQIGVSLQVCIIASHPNPRYPKAPSMNPLPMINPTIISFTDKKVKDWEGCLSIPGIRGKVPRYEQVLVEFINSNGQKKKKSFDGFVARIVQHEIDHLQGKVFLDRMGLNGEIITEKHYKKLTRS